MLTECPETAFENVEPVRCDPRELRLPITEHDVREYFCGHPQAAADPAVLAWRTYCFNEGLLYAAHHERHIGALAGARVLDLACGWGGHALAFASKGAAVTASDMSDYDFARLNAFSAENGLRLQTACGDCQQLPYEDESFDVILALHVIEHLPQPKRFAREVTRLLRPGGVCFLATPARLRSVLEGEPHYGLKLLALLPLGIQKKTAKTVFKSSYPFPVFAQYTSARSIIRLFDDGRMQGCPDLGWGRLQRLLQRHPHMLRFAADFLFYFVVLKKAG